MAGDVPTLTVQAWLFAELVAELAHFLADVAELRFHHSHRDLWATKLEGS
jgi:hypothetical protein